jgi:hypothetical protein
LEKRQLDYDWILTPMQEQADMANENVIPKEKTKSRRKKKKEEE